MQEGLGTPFGPLDALRYPIPKSRKAMSRVKKSRKNATVDLSVQISRRVVKIHQPCHGISISGLKVKVK